MTLYVATTNPGKLRDFAHAAELAATSRGPGPLVVILPLPGLHQLPIPEETEPTFLGNATLKALFYSRHAPGLTVLADDSGLEVDALGGAPGVRSARYADDRAIPLLLNSSRNPDERNNLTLLHDLDARPAADRSARYRCSLVAARDGALLATADGTVEGTLLSAPQGAAGFGYDPLFYLPDLNLTMAEVDPATRLNRSHRGRALHALLSQLRNA